MGIELAAAGHGGPTMLSCGSAFNLKFARLTLFLTLAPCGCCVTSGVAARRSWCQPTVLLADGHVRGAGGHVHVSAARGRPAGRSRPVGPAPAAALQAAPFAPWRRLAALLLRGSSPASLHERQRWPLRSAAPPALRLAPRSARGARMHGHGPRACACRPCSRVVTT